MSEYIENTVGCDFYLQGRCKLYEDKFCIGNKCIIWGMCEKQNNLKVKLENKDHIINEEIDKTIFLLRLIANSKNCKLYHSDDTVIIQIEDCDQFCFKFQDRVTFILNLFYDCEQYPYLLEDVEEFDLDSNLFRIGL